MRFCSVLTIETLHMSAAGTSPFSLISVGRYEKNISNK